MKKWAGKTSKRVTFELTAEPGSRVYVAGTFNKWDPAADPMKDNPDGGHYAAALRLAPGRHEYKFVVNGDWRLDPNCADSVPNAHGSRNSVIVV